MKILIACINFMPQNLRRQPWFYMNSISEALCKKGYDVWILTDKEAKWPEDKKVIFFEKFRSALHGVDLKISDLIEKESFDIVVWSTGLTDFFFKNKIDVLKVPIIAVVTSPRYTLKELFSLGKDLIINGEYLKPFFVGPLLSERRVKAFLDLPNLRAVIFECEETLNRYIPRKVLYKNIFIAPPPLPADFLKILDDIKFENGKCEKDSPKILYFGPPINLRGIDTLIQAVSIVRRKIKNIRLDILSRIEYQSLLRYERKIKALIKKKDLIHNTRIISGLLNPDDLVKHVISSDIVCLPFKCVISDVPISVLETLATGIPLITTEVAGVSEFAKNTKCHVVPPNDPKSLSEAILKAIEVCDRRHHKNEGKVQLIDKYNLSNFTSSFEKIINRVI